MPPRKTLRACVRATLVLLAAAIAVVLVSSTLVDEDARPRGERVVTVATAAPPPAPAPPAGDLEATKDASSSRGIDPADAPLRDDTPEDIAPEVLKSGLEKTDDLGQDLEPRPIGGAQNYECRQDFDGHVWSSYSIKPTEGVFHYTVSANIVGRADVNAIVGYFERTRIASADRVIDFEGNCTQMVPITTGKAWTAGAANNAACFQYEIIATGRETRAQWLASPLIARGILAEITRDDAARCGIPLTRVDPQGCVFPPGLTDHNALECGNDHTDVAPTFPWDKVMAQLRGPDPAAITRTDRTRCSQIRDWRRAGRPKGGAWERKSVWRRRALERRGLTCTSSGVRPA